MKREVALRLFDYLVAGWIVGFFVSNAAGHILRLDTGLWLAVHGIVALLTIFYMVGKDRSGSGTPTRRLSATPDPDQPQ